MRDDDDGGKERKKMGKYNDSPRKLGEIELTRFGD